MTWSSCGVMLLFLWVQQVQLAETSSVATQGKKIRTVIIFNLHLKCADVSLAEQIMTALSATI